MLLFPTIFSSSSPPGTATLGRHCVYVFVGQICILLCENSWPLGTLTMSGLILNTRGREYHRALRVLIKEELQDWCTSRLRGILQMVNWGTQSYVCQGQPSTFLVELIHHFVVGFQPAASLIHRHNFFSGRYLKSQLSGTVLFWASSYNMSFRVWWVSIWGK